MPSEVLQWARDFESSHAPGIPTGLRPGFHVTGTVGWINDPNGFSLYRGEYHLFYQYHPYSNFWGPMHWGHVKSKDLVRWERLPVALAPDREEDREGCFSGSAVELPDGRHLLMYTGVGRGQDRDGSPCLIQRQCLAVGDGVNYEKLAENPVLDGGDLPRGGSLVDFRDPKLWRDGDKFCAVVGNRAADGGGSILLFESDDGFRWHYAATLDASCGKYGKMWECPDFFSLDGEQVLLFSPQEMQSEGEEFHPGFGTVCFLGDYEKETRTFTRKRVQTVDYGTDFYAPQTMEAPDGRRLMVAWMQNWETCKLQPKDMPFFGMMTVPRELSVRDGRLCQVPVRELEQYRGEKTAYHGVRVAGKISLDGVKGRMLDLTATIRPGEEPLRWFQMNLTEGGGFGAFLRYDGERSLLRIDRTNTGFPFDIVNIREFPVRLRDGALKVRVLLDRYSAEIFVNDGEQAASVVLYTPAEAEGVSFEAGGAALLDIESYPLTVRPWG